MSNLVPLHIDKETGKLVAKSTGLQGAQGHEHEQIIPASTWTVSHNGATTLLIHRIFNATLEEIIPDGFRIIDSDNVEVSFATPQTGFAHLIFFTQV